ncbi:MAG: hypothetical protein RLZZ557_894, partial [Bacteroidota bacterium]
MFRTSLLTFFTAVTFALAASAQTKTDKLMIDILGSIDNDTAKKVLADPDKFRVQI